MNVKTNVSVKNLSGDDVVVEGDALLVKTAIINALLSAKGRDASGEGHLKRFNLAQKFHSDEDGIEITAEDISLAKALVAEVYAPLVVGRVFEALEA